MSTDHCLWSRLLVVLFCPLKNVKQLCCQLFCTGVVGCILVWERNTNYRVCRCTCRLVFGRCRVRIWAATQTVPTESFRGFLEHLHLLLRCDLDYSTISSILTLFKSSSTDRPTGHAVFRVWGFDNVVKYTKKGRKNYRYLKTVFITITGIWRQFSLQLQVFEDSVHYNCRYLATVFITITGIWRQCSLQLQVFEDIVHYNYRYFKTLFGKITGIRRRFVH